MPAVVQWRCLLGDALFTRVLLPECPACRHLLDAGHDAQRLREQCLVYRACDCVEDYLRYVIVRSTACIFNLAVRFLASLLSVSCSMLGLLRRVRCKYVDPWNNGVGKQQTKRRCGQPTRLDHPQFSFTTSASSATTRVWIAWEGVVFWGNCAARFSAAPKNLSCVMQGHGEGPGLEMCVDA